MRLLLGLSTVREVGQDSCKTRSLVYLICVLTVVVGNLPVTLFAEPPLHAEIMMSSSMMVSLIWGLPDCTTNTSFSRTLVKMRTLVSPWTRSHCQQEWETQGATARQRAQARRTFENWDKSAEAGVKPKFSHILPDRAGHEVPEKTSVLRIFSRVREKSFWADERKVQVKGRKKTWCGSRSTGCRLVLSRRGKARKREEGEKCMGCCCLIDDWQLVIKDSSKLNGSALS